jgi:hypothetical protein
VEWGQLRDRLGGEECGEIAPVVPGGCVSAGGRGGIWIAEDVLAGRCKTKNHLCDYEEKPEQK